MRPRKWPCALVITKLWRMYQEAAATDEHMPPAPSLGDRAAAILVELGYVMPSGRMRPARLRLPGLARNRSGAV
jgi:hypothetical protein